jgi:hypothetical protein
MISDDWFATVEPELPLPSFYRPVSLVSVYVVGDLPSVPGEGLRSGNVGALVFVQFVSMLSTPSVPLSRAYFPCLDDLAAARLRRLPPTRALRK